MKKRILACLLALVMLIGVLPVMALAVDSSAAVSVSEGKAKVASTGDKEYDTLDAAMKAAEDGDTIYLGEGIYCGNAEHPTEQNQALKFVESGSNKEKMKSLTFVGAGTGKTTWQIRALKQYGRDGWCDYSFKDSDSITFQNMTVIGSVYLEGSKWARVGHKDTQGLTYINHITLENCIFNGRADYWGYKTTTFENVTFNAPGTEASGIPDVDNKVDYSLWTYTGESYTFKNCTFNSAGKTVNVYRHGDSGYDITVNFEDCTAINTGISLKPVLNINDSTLSDEHKYFINISGDNSVSGVGADDITCSRLFGFGGKRKIENNAGKTEVNINGVKVWENGERAVDHNCDEITAGSYTNGITGASDAQYTDGYKDNAFTVTETGWVQQSDGSYKWMVTRVCQYCGYTETVEETKRDEVDDITAVLLPALQANTDDHYSYLIGYADGTVRPNGKITRAEVATIFFRLLDDDTRAKYWSSENNFSDVSADKWYNNAVSTLSRMGVIGGYADGTFRPDAPISRAEFAKIAVSFTQNNGSAVYNYFTDVKTTDWFAPYVTAAKDAGLIEGYSDGSFKPESKITRAEACAIVNRTLGRKPSKAHMKISDRIDWPDVQTTDWFYEAIMEATNSHTCTMGDRVETWTGKLPQRDWATLETGWANAYTGR